MPQPTAAANTPGTGPSVTPPPSPDQKAVEESKQETVSQPGGFANDPDDPTNPNEEIHRLREKLRP